MLLAAAVWTLLLIGVFVMHGAGSHGTNAHTSAPVGDVLTLTADHGGQAGHEGAAHDAASPQDSGDDERESPGHRGAELCLAILCALLATLAALVVLTRARRPLFIRRRAATAHVPPWLRPPDPPCLIRLSILRC